MIKKIDEYTEKNLKNAKICELAELLGYSVIYTGSLVKKLKGKTFSKLLQDKRCSTAAELLEQTDMSVGEIISCVGYENETFFRRAFKEKYGKNPLDYRKGR